MVSIKVIFEYRTGLGRRIFKNVRLTGSWDALGRYGDTWITVAMQEFVAEDGVPAWRAAVCFDDSQLGKTFRWGVRLDNEQNSDAWGIAREINEKGIDANYCEFLLQENNQVERYWLTTGRKLGANKEFRTGKDPGICFSVWAPNARMVELVPGDPVSGYLWDEQHKPEGSPTPRGFSMIRDNAGIWRTAADDATFARFADWNHRPYMFRITKDDETIAYRTDLYSRCQIGSGSKDPARPKGEQASWDGTCKDLDGTKSCSVVIDPDLVARPPNEPLASSVADWQTESEFWAQEFDPARPLPTRVEDLVIYELHVKSLGFGKAEGGTFQDAVALLDHLVDLGVNAIELLPISEFEGQVSWGYGTSHYFAIEFSCGGRDQLKYFVRECHRRGMVVLLDVVYNHFTHDGERAQWLYDTNAHHHNLFYWYEGEQDWGKDGHGGYLDNGSTGYSPNFRSPMVRGMLISSAAVLVTEFHIDGLRVDLTQAIHRDHVIHENGRRGDQACRYGIAFLKEWVATLRLIKPKIFLMAEDHSGWNAITDSQASKGIGFDATWWAEWYHHLVGDATHDGGKARLIYNAGLGNNDPLRMDWMAAVLGGCVKKVIYHESHDEAGNSSYEDQGKKISSARTMMVSVNGFLFDNTRAYAEARSRVAAGITLLAPGTPMFFMGEEVGAINPFRYDDFLKNREDISSLRSTTGASMFRFYQDVIRLRRESAAFRSPFIEIIHVHNENRVLVFRRWLDNAAFLVIVSLSNKHFDSGYWITHDSLAGKNWKEVLNSDARLYGGAGVGNSDPIRADGNRLDVKVPSNGIVVLAAM